MVQTLSAEGVTTLVLHASPKIDVKSAPQDLYSGTAGASTNAISTSIPRMDCALPAPPTVQRALTTWFVPHVSMDSP